MACEVKQDFVESVDSLIIIFLNISFTVSSRLNKRSEKTEWAQGADDGRERQILNQHAPQELRPLTPLE